MTLGLLERLEGQGSLLEIVVQALMTSYVGHRSRVPKVELVDFYVDWLVEPSWSVSVPMRHHLSMFVEEALGWVGDSGLLDVTRDHVQLTEAGDVFVSWWLQYLDS